MSTYTYTTPTTNYAVDLSNLFLGYADFLKQIPVASISSVINTTTGALTTNAYTQNFYSVQGTESFAPVFYIQNYASSYTTTGTNTLFVTVRSGYTMNISLDGGATRTLTAGTYTFGPGNLTISDGTTLAFGYLTVLSISVAT